MRAIEKLPPAFKRFRKIGGVLDFTIFEDADDEEETALSAVAAAMPPKVSFDVDALRLLGNRHLKERAFFGDWYDVQSSSLLKLGHFRTADGVELENPKFKKLDRVKIKSSASPCPNAGAGGQFAYAFSSPPYALRARPSEVQLLFDEIRNFILPTSEQNKILDWSSPRLPEVSDYFATGMEWWGVFLFTIHIPTLQRLTAIAGSTTD